MKRLLSTRSPQHGFALIITLALVAMLVLVVLALTSLVKVDSKLTDTTLSQTKARQNALLALDVAIAQLQKHAGPDARATATGESFGSAGAKYYTGVWGDITGGATAKTWLVSGSESPTTNPVALLDAALDPTTEPTPNEVFLVGDNTLAATLGAATAEERAMRVKLPKIPILGEAPGLGNAARIGSYAWWVGDQGVKAAIAQVDRSIDLNFAPFQSSAELRSRVRQQTSLGASPIEFDPRDTTHNARRTAGIGTSPVERITATAQLGLLSPSASSGPSLAGIVRQRFHAWTAQNYSVLANTSDGGLRQDLSIRPTLLGTAFAAWANYTTYMEPTTTTGATAPFPAYGTDPQRRRYKITPHLVNSKLAHGVAPVLVLFTPQFNVRTTGNTIDVRFRMHVALWNPYTSSLVPEDLLLEVSGLPTLQVEGISGISSSTLPVSLQTVFGGDPVRITLTSSNPSFANESDTRSWLPGRIFFWATKGGTVGNWQTVIYTKNTVADVDIWKAQAGNFGFNPSKLKIRSNQTVELKLSLRRASDKALIAEYVMPKFDPFEIEKNQPNGEFFGFPVRLFEFVDRPEDPDFWLFRDERDFRIPTPKSDIFRDYGNAFRPELYSTSLSLTKPERLMDRVMGTTGKSFNEDAPLFELPRAPLLSVGQLQHLQVAGRRPFTIGNSWGNTNTDRFNAYFDRYFFSGLATGVTAPNFAAGAPLPNVSLTPLATKADGTPVTATDLTAQAATGFSSKFLMQSSAFNVNSTNVDAWIAVLRSASFSTGTRFNYVNSSTASGSGSDTPAAQLSPLPTDAVFYRFPQSAQETYKADANYMQSSGTGPQHIINTHLFRRGVRTLNQAETRNFAEAIVGELRTRLASFGPFRSLEEFLAPSLTHEGKQVSLLEKAIAQAGLNNAYTEFHSQWLTQADVLSVLAPLLFPRSDTFVIRTYGETVNPTLPSDDPNFITGRAWCEAIVQRVPEYLDPTQAEETLPNALNALNQRNGRRFKVVSFRWLTNSEI